MPDRFGKSDWVSGITAADVDQRPDGEGLSTVSETAEQIDPKTKAWIDETLSQIQRKTKPQPQRSSGLRPRPTILEDLKHSYLLWFPWSLGIGIIIYLQIVVELQLQLLMWTVPSLVVGGLSLFVLPPVIRKPMTLLLGIVLGLIAIEYRVSNLPSLPLKAPYGTQTAKVMVLEQQSKEGRVRVDVKALEEITFPDGRAFDKFRLWGRAHEAYRVGAVVTLKFKLRPVSRPTHLGGYNPRWYAFFSGTAANGLIYGYPRVDAIDVNSATSMKSGVRWFFARLRDRVVQRLAQVLPASSRGIAQALLTGQRSQVPAEQTENLRKSGLSHILAISGLHISLVFGFCFLLMRGFTPLLGRMAVMGRTRNVALGAALLVALAYMLLAGSPLPTIRALTMTGLFAFALYLRRQPFSLNALALAASVILILWPESLTSPSFLLSFSVVLALVAAARANQARKFQQRHKPQSRGVIAKTIAPVKGYFLGVITTSLIATLVSMPISIYYFQDHSLVGIFANLVAVPLAAFWIMPLAVLGLLFMPFGLDAPFITMMGWGIDWLVAIAAISAEWDVVNFWVPPINQSLLLTYILGLCLLCFHRSRLRLAAPVLGVCVLFFAYQTTAPSLLVSSDPLVMGLVQGHEIQAVTHRKNQSFTLGRWAKSFVPTENAFFRDVTKPYEAKCDFEGCILKVPLGEQTHAQFTTLAFTTHEAAAVRDCQTVDLLITTTRLTERLKSIYACRAELVAMDVKSLKQQAPLSIWIKSADDLLSQKQIYIETYAERMKNRPWF